MAFENLSNDSRVEKITTALKHVNTSAKSNRASPEQIHALLIPVLEKLGELGIYCSPEVPPSAAPATPQPHVPGQRLSLSDYVQAASLSECSSAIALCMTRVDEALVEAGAM